MRKGLSLAEFLIAITILVLIATPISAYFYKLIKTTFKEQQTRQNLKQLHLALDIICQDLAQAKEIKVYPASIYIIRNNDQYTYCLANQRLAKQRESLMYITPAEILINKFKCQQKEQATILELETSIGDFTRIVKKHS